MKLIATFLFAGILSSSCLAAVKLSAILSDGMVLQHGVPIKIWGTCLFNEKIFISFAGINKNTIGSKDGTWQIVLPAVKPGGPYVMKIEGTNKIIIKNILAGEVWLCSGQSNMEFPLQMAANAAAELQDANYPMIRQFEVEKKVSLQPLSNVQNGQWISASAKTAGNFSAVAFFYAKELYKQLKMPIGIINASVGGTILETWMSRQAISNALFSETIKHIPNETIAEILLNKENLLLNKINKLQGNLPNKTITNLWTEPAFNDEHWSTLQVPGYWETQGWEQLNGTVYYRLNFNLSADDATQKTILSLGKIDDSDSAWINGNLVGSLKNKPTDDRKYLLKEGVLKAGENTIVVAIEDYGGGGGFISGPEELYLLCGNKKKSLAGTWKYQVAYVNSNSFQVFPNDYPTLLFNAMIHPLLNYQIKGVIWYQGESNTSRAAAYAQSFILLINDWRRHWHRRYLPFGFIQLSSFEANTDIPGKGSTWAELRESQAHALTMKNTGMAVTTDIGNTLDIHPKNKQDVGIRLASWALHKIYNLNIPFEGPIFAFKEIKKNTIIIHFKKSENAFLIKDSAQIINGFEIAEKGKRFFPAKAKIHGHNIIVYNLTESKPADVRYAWKDDAGKANVFNKEGFPLAPFRTDKNALITENITYKIGL